MTNKLTQSKGSSATYTSKTSISLIYGIPPDNIQYLSTSSSILSSTLILYDYITTTCWNVGTATGMPISWTVNSGILELQTTTGTYNLSPMQTHSNTFINLHDYYKSTDGDDWYPAFTRAFAVSTNIFIPFGTHTVYSTLNVPSGTQLIGLGTGSIIKSPDASSSNGSNLVTVIRGQNVSNITLQNLLISGGVNETNTSKNYTRTVRFNNCTNVKVQSVSIINNADWSLSFEGGSDFLVSDYKQRSYVYTNTSISLDGGRDGLHFMDCSNVMAINLDIESGDDCVGITTTGTDMNNITVKGLRGKSNIASLVIYNEEQDSGGVYYSNNLSNLVIQDVIAKTSSNGRSARNIVRVIAYGATTNISNVSITSIKGSAYNSYGVWIQKVSNVYVNDIDVSSQQAHGVYLNLVSKMSGNINGTYLGTNASSSFAGVNISSLSNSMVTVGSTNSYGYGVQIASSTDSTIIPDIYNCGSGLFATNNGGNLRIVNCTNIDVPYGRCVGSNTISYYGINQSGNTNLDIGLDLKFSGYTNTTLPTSYNLKLPVVDVKFKEDSAGTIINHLLYGASFVRNSVGNYTITFDNPMRSTNFSWSASAYRNGALIFVRLASAVGVSSITLQVVDSSNVATYADHIEFKAYNT